MLPEGQFACCHRTLLVNLAQVRHVRYCELELRNGERLPISKYRLAQFKSAFSALLKRLKSDLRLRETQNRHATKMGMAVSCKKQTSVCRYGRGRLEGVLRAFDLHQAVVALDNAFDDLQPQPVSVAGGRGEQPFSQAKIK